MADALSQALTSSGADVSSSQSILVGTGESNWIWSANGWDLTHSQSPGSSRSRGGVTLNCELVNVRIDPKKTALVIIDMQNMVLDTALAPSAVTPMYDAENAILHCAIPASRRLGLQVIWLNWCLTEQDLLNLPPAEVRVFAFKANTDRIDYGLQEPRGDPNDPHNFLTCGECPNLLKLPGAELGEVISDDGIRVDAGRAMMQGTWNTALHGRLAAAYEKGQTTSRPDVWICKNRNSGLWHAKSAMGEYLKKEGIRTLLFSGVNTDQCVGSTLQDAHALGYDTIMLKDGCATDSPPYVKASYEFNCARAWGFLSSCKALAKAADLGQQDELSSGK